MKFAAQYDCVWHTLNTGLLHLREGLGSKQKWARVERRKSAENFEMAQGQSLTFGFAD